MIDENKPLKVISKKRSQNFSRPVLNKDTEIILKEIHDKVKGDFISPSASKMACWIINWFYHNEFSNSLDAIKRDFFDKEKFVKNALSNSGEKPIEEILKETLSVIEIQKRPKKRQPKIKKQGGLNEKK